MAYARFGWEGSDVYIFLSVYGKLDCCACSIESGYQANSTDEMLAHLNQHIEAGDTVPDSCFEYLRRDKEENDLYIKEYLE